MKKGGKIVARKDDNGKDYNGFYCYKDYIDLPKQTLTEEEFKEFAVCLLNYGVYGKYEIQTESATVLALLDAKCAMIDATNRRYQHAIRCGELGGRERLFSDDDLKEAIIEKGLHTQKELAAYFNCSVRTIQRRINGDDEIRRCYSDSRKKT